MSTQTATLKHPSRGVCLLTLLLFLVGLLSLFGCTLTPPPDEPESIAVIAMSPEPFSIGNLRNQEVSFWFSRPLHPGTLGTTAIIVQSQEVRQSGTIRYSPIDNRLTYRPSGNLRQNLTYDAVLSDSLRGLRERRAVETVTLTFETGEVIYEPPPVPEPDFESQILPLLGRSCAYASCHAPPSPAAGLDLSSHDGLVTTGIAVESSGWSRWARIDPYSAAWSYLIYKVIGEETVLGEQMPPGVQLSRDEMYLLARWIDWGAKVDPDADAP